MRNSVIDSFTDRGAVRGGLRRILPAHPRRSATLTENARERTLLLGARPCGGDSREVPDLS